MQNKDKKPFTESEEKIMQLIVDANNKFMALESAHPMEKQ